jgi:UDP-glucose 4-epimerase
MAATPAWLAALRESPSRSVVVTGGAGQLGSRFAALLTECGHRVTVVDVRPPVVDDLRFVPFDLRYGPLPPGLMGAPDAVVHLAGLHGPHLKAGGRRGEFWLANVRATQAVLEAAVAAGARRFVLASSTSVYGSGSPAGEPARVLAETTPTSPGDAYDLTKLCAETLLRDAALETVTLRFGRFDFTSHTDYQIRKLSTGLDLWDACQALALALGADRLDRFMYNVASDLTLTTSQRQRLGVDASGVLADAYPEVLDAARRGGIALPARVGKSVVTEAIRADLGYRPERTLEWAAQDWAGRARPGPRLPAAIGPADLFPLAL